ncbi:HD domain-containing protein, partial [bacterium]|nr:HD domain-containing protein [bacterium]
ESDYLVTGMPMDDLTRILRGFGHVELVGRAFGVLKFKLAIEDRAARTVDVALPRRERSTGHGHRDFEIEYDPELPVEQDLRRRDFTINAIALPLAAHGRRAAPALVDPYGGLQDIRDNIIRIVDPAAFEQDPLRMLRACQFAARFEYALERGTFESVTKHAALVATVSPERVQQELNKLLLRAEQPSIGLWLMQRSGLLEEVVPELAAGAGVDQPGDFHRYDVFQHSIKTVDHVPRDRGLVLRLAALLHDVAKPGCRQRDGGRVHFYGHDRQGELAARAVLERLRYPRDTVQAVCSLVRQHMFAYPETERGLRRLIAKTGVAGFYDLVDLRRADILAQGRAGEGTTAVLDRFEQLATAEIRQKRPFSLADLAVDGDDLQREFGLRPGPALGRLLGHLLEHVLEHPARNHRDALLEEAARRLARGGGPP